MYNDTDSKKSIALSAPEVPLEKATTLRLQEVDPTEFPVSPLCENVQWLA